MTTLKTKIGLFGGTFNPVHIGHLLIGDWIREEYNLDRIIYIPSGHPPHKREKEITPIVHRWEMLEHAISGNPYFSLSDVEKNPGRVSFTIDTVKHFVQQFSLHRDDLYLIVGEDSLRDLPTWRAPDEIAKLCRITVAHRRGFTSSTISSPSFSDILFSSVPLIDISSSEIRTRASEEKSIRYMVPPEVEEYIRKNELYKKI